MARKIIVLDQPGLPSDLTYRVAFWLTVPASRQPYQAVLNAGTRSQVIGPAAPTAAELNDFATGAVIEQVVTVPFVPGTPLATILAQLQSLYNAAQAQSDSAAFNQWNRYGSSWDGTTWTGVTVA